MSFWRIIGHPTHWLIYAQVKHPASGYVQGMNYVAAFCLLVARGDGDATELLRRGMEAQNNRPAAVRARRALLAVAEEAFHWWKKPLANEAEDDDSVPEVPGTTI